VEINQERITYTLSSLIERQRIEESYILDNYKLPPAYIVSLCPYVKENGTVCKGLSRYIFDYLCTCEYCDTLYNSKVIKYFKVKYVAYQIDVPVKGCFPLSLSATTMLIWLSSYIKLHSEHHCLINLVALGLTYHIILIYHTTV